MIEDMPGGSKARQKGTQFEVELLPLMRSLFGESVTRSPLQGFNDHGDFTNVPFLIEAKNHLLPKFQEWARTCEKKDVNWAIIWKGDRRKGSGQGPYVMMPLDMFERLCRAVAFVVHVHKDEDA